MPTEAYILRRTFPVPVTFADLKRAALEMQSPPFWGKPWMALVHAGDTRLAPTREWWHAAIKEATSALDEVYAVVDGREVRVAIVAGAGEGAHAETPSVGAAHVNALLIAADEAGYWSRPHEVRIDLEESQMSHKTMARIAGNSFIVAGVK